MLENLHVKNLALIDEIEVEFCPGLNILTGETGAGKSILLGSVNLALGGKYSADLLRTGAKFGLVELTFSGIEGALLEQLESMDVYPEDGRIDSEPEAVDREKYEQDQWRNGQHGASKRCGKPADRHSWSA